MTNPLLHRGLMVATLCLIGCMLAPAQQASLFDSPPAGDRLQGPRLARAQEFVYRGTYAEESGLGRVQFSRTFRIDIRVFVLTTPPTGADVAILTVLKPRDSHVAIPAGVSGEIPASSVRLEFARVDLQGRLHPEPGVSLQPALDGPPTLEAGMFIEVPSSRVVAEGSWETVDTDRPPRSWKLVGIESVNGANCTKIQCTQQSEDWEKPRADRSAWHRIDTIWYAPRVGIAYRVERTVERREPARQDSSQKCVVRYELESSLQYPAPLYEDRRQEIAQARAFSDAALPLLVNPSQHNNQLNVLSNKIAYHLEHQTPTPYREAVLAVKRRVEAGQRGEALPALAPEKSESTSIASVGAQAPDFVANQLTGPEGTTFRLRRSQGQPKLLVFYNPASPNAGEVLQFADGLRQRFAGVMVLGLSVNDDAKAVRRQHADLGLGFTIVSGDALRISYAVETTPKFVLIDATGAIRGSYLGWGRETAIEVQNDLRRWLRPKP